MTSWSMGISPMRTGISPIGIRTEPSILDFSFSHVSRMSSSMCGCSAGASRQALYSDGSISMGTFRVDIHVSFSMGGHPTPHRGLPDDAMTRGHRRHPQGERGAGLEMPLQSDGRFP